MKNYKIVNDLTGWFIFAIAAFTYCMTIEPTASFWDCPEFITTAAKLEVGHPPGAPFFMLFGNLFAQFASDASQVAMMINIMNALLSAGCILFLFWSITHFAKKLIVRDDAKSVSLSKTIAIMASGVAGALIYTWSDTFWFSAVEGEVYAFSSFITALVFWLILKWENRADEVGSDRWLILIAYLVGLSIGVHLLNLLCIPAIVLVFYYKKCKNPDLKGSLMALGVSALLVAAVLYGIVPGIVKVGGWFELMFVNGMGLAYNSGLYAYLGLLVASLVWALVESTKAVSKMRMNVSFLLSVALLGVPFYGHGTFSVVIGLVVLGALAVFLFNNKNVTSRLLNTSLLCMTLITVGYASYAVIVIRSTANPPMDQNSPEDIFTLGEYLSREQYGDRPLFMGETYASQPEIVEEKGTLKYNLKKGAPVYQRKDKTSAEEKDEYIVVHEKINYVYPSNQTMVFPRIYSKKDEGRYRSWLGNIKTHSVQYNIPGQGAQSVEIPNYSENLRFFFSYQMNFMYWRYFMWNFAGRQNDLQGNGELEHGNWITGIDFIDNAIYGTDLSNLPSDLTENKGHNVFYCLPLLLGLLGFFCQAFRDKNSIQQFWVVFFLFFMTGIAIVIYLNQTPGQPRERDYAYAGSFYAFAIWCGLGITAIFDVLSKWMSEKRGGAIVAAVVAAVPAVGVPLQMVGQTWDDHDRSNRYVCRDFGLNYLETVPEDGIIFTCGDNDTFPLWYNEDTEGKRTDVRVCNLSYLQTDWYIDQMKRPAYGSTKLPISWERWQYTTGKNEMIEVNPSIVTGIGEMKANDLIEVLCNEDSVLYNDLWQGKPYEYSTVIKHFVLKEPFSPEFEAKHAQFVKIVRDILPTCIPTNVLYVTVNKDNVRKSGMMIVGDSIPDRMDISLANRMDISKSELMMLEIIANNNFERPVYMSTTVGTSNYGSLYRHFIQEGIAYRITPFTIGENRAMIRNLIDSDKMYDNMMNKYAYGNLKHEGLYLDETTMRMCHTHRRWFSSLINALVDEGKHDMALKALDKCEAEIPSYNVPHDSGSGSVDMAQAYVVCGQPDKADAILKQLKKTSEEYNRWYLGLEGKRFASIINNDSYRHELSVLSIIGEIYSSMAEVVNDEAKKKQYDESSKECENLLNSFYQEYYIKSQRLNIGLN